MNNSNRSFASDNSSGIHPDILEAIQNANKGHVLAYGHDIYTERAIAKFKEHFGKDTDPYIVFGGTPANVIGLSIVVQPYNSVLCASSAHVITSECGAAERFIGCKLIGIPTDDGKITPAQIKPYLKFGNDHNNQPKVISITQPTEVGTLYTVKEIKALAELAHKNNMLLHMDGARISNAAASLGLQLKEFTTDAGVDLLSFGGTKNGLMGGDAIISLNKELSKDAMYIRMEGMQLPSKMRFISAQFEAFLSNDLYLKNAMHSNKMAQLLAKELGKIPHIKIMQKVQANVVFANIPKKYLVQLQKAYYFHVWSSEKSIARLMMSFDTTKEDILEFVALAKKIIK